MRYLEKIILQIIKEKFRTKIKKHKIVGLKRERENLKNKRE